VARGEDVRVLMRSSSTNRAVADLSLEYVTGDLRDPASLDRALAGVQYVFHVAADYRLWARKSREIYDSNVGGTKNLLEAAKRAKVEKFIYTSTVATIAVDRPELPTEATDARLEEMVGHYKRSKWMAEREALTAAREGLPVVIAMPKTHSNWENNSRFSQRENARIRGDRSEFCRSGRVCRRPSAGRGKR
jgi:dihydroflavonol-4-reductase